MFEMDSVHDKALGLSLSLRARLRGEILLDSKVGKGEICLREKTSYRLSG